MTLSVSNGMKKISHLLLLALLALAAACQSDDTQAPAYLRIEAVTLQHGTDAQWVHKDDGFVSSLVDAVNIRYYNQGDTAWTNLGAFQLPCQLPVLGCTTIDTMVIEPVVKLNGISATRAYYTFYKEITFGHLTLHPDQVLNLDTLHTTYKSSNTVHVAWEEYFHPVTSPKLDSVVRTFTNRDTALTGGGCGVIRVGSDQKTLNFWSHDSLVVRDHQILYLEMDYWTDFDLSVGFNNPMATGGSNQINSAMTLYRNHGWQKIYISLGSLWSFYSYYPYLRLYFSILNNEGREGNVFIDNLKVVYM